MLYENGNECQEGEQKKVLGIRTKEWKLSSSCKGTNKNVVEHWRIVLEFNECWNGNQEKTWNIHEVKNKHNIRQGVNTDKNTDNGQSYEYREEGILENNRRKKNGYRNEEVEINRWNNRASFLYTGNDMQEQR